ncbi:MAG: hypothetical protein QM747_18055 [Nocardioides sp.]
MSSIAVQEDPSRLEDRFGASSLIRTPPAGMDFGCVSDVAADSEGAIYLLTREPGLVLRCDETGHVYDVWGDEHLSHAPHGIEAVGDTVVVADAAAHSIVVFDRGGRLVNRLGTAGSPSATGIDTSIEHTLLRALSVQRGGGPFNRPTNAAAHPDGRLYVSDGYQNSRVHVFRDNELAHSWGEPGPLPGQFCLVHHVAVTAEQVYVTDRENERIQIFDPDGEFLSQWRDVQRPACVQPLPDGTLLVSELAWAQGALSLRRGRIASPMPARLSVRDRDGRLLARSGSPGPPESGPTFHFLSPHGVAVDPAGAIYVADLFATGGSRDMVQRLVPRSTGL